MNDEIIEALIKEGPYTKSEATRMYRHYVIVNRVGLRLYMDRKKQRDAKEEG